jgi:hypothetical protein
LSPLEGGEPLRFVFKYKIQEVTNPATGSMEMYSYPVLPCTFERRGRKTSPTEGILDSGSDGLVLPMGVAKVLELELRDEKKPMRVVSHEVPRFSAQVDLTIGRGGRYFIFRDVVASIPKEGDTPILIGRDPVFRLYRVTFDDSESTITLEPVRRKH